MSGIIVSASQLENIDFTFDSFSKIIGGIGMSGIAEIMMRTGYTVQGSDAKASASRKAAMEELKKSEADYKTKVSALGDATEATWDSAKQNAIASWDRLQAAYYKARAD